MLKRANVQSQAVFVLKKCFEDDSILQNIFLKMIVHKKDSRMIQFFKKKSCKKRDFNKELKKETLAQVFFYEFC